MIKKGLKLNKIVFILFLAIILVGCSNEESKGRVDILEKVSNDDTTAEALDEFIEGNDYEFYTNNSDGEKYSYIKNTGDKVTLSYLENESYESVFIFSKDYSKEDSQVSFILTATTKNSKYIYSIYPDKSNTILIEKEVYKDCSVDECTVEAEAEIVYEHYTYNVETEELNSLGNVESDLKYKDISDDLDTYFDELEAIYETE